MRATAIALTVSAALALSGNLHAASGPAGRWQLFQGEYQFINIKGEEYWSRGLFKLDTVTGEIFECYRNQFDGAYIGKPEVQVQLTECRPFETSHESPKQKN